MVVELDMGKWRVTVMVDISMSPYCMLDGVRQGRRDI